MSTQTRLSTLVINMVAVLVVATPSAVYPSSAANQDSKAEIVQAESSVPFSAGKETTLNLELSRPAVSIPTVSESAIAVSSGSQHTCALTSAAGMKCWGRNIDGRLGDGTTSDRHIPTDVVGLSQGVSAISAGEHHTCALKNGGVLCWGSNDSGELGDGSTTTRLTPTNVVGLDKGVVAISAGLSHTCALMTTGGVKCWGWGYGFGVGTKSQLTPIDVIGLTQGVRAVVAGYNRTCAITIVGGVKCWGDNHWGQLGDGTTISRDSPTDVIGLSYGVIDVALIGSSSCALTIYGGMKCWGYGAGDGTNGISVKPVTPSGLDQGVTAIAALCAVTSGSGVKCWNSGDSYAVPAVVLGLGPSQMVKAIVRGESRKTCVLTGASAVKCWGPNNFGELGDGTTTDRPTPVDVVGLGGGNSATATPTPIAISPGDVCGYFSVEVERSVYWGIFHNELNGEKYLNYTCDFANQCFNPETGVRKLYPARSVSISDISPPRVSPSGISLNKWITLGNYGIRSIPVSQCVNSGIPATSPPPPTLTPIPTARPTATSTPAPQLFDGAELHSQSEYITVFPGQQIQPWIKIRNSGTTTWRAGQYGFNYNNIAPYLGSAGKMSQDVLPGTVIEFRNSSYIIAPLTPGTYWYGVTLTRPDGTMFGYFCAKSPPCYQTQVTVVQAVTATPIPATSTPIPPSATSTSTATRIPPTATPTSTSTPRPPITGYVRSNDGVPLPGIKVVAGYDYQRESDDPFKHQNEPQQIAVAYTNAAGEFRLENPWNETRSFGNGFVRKGFIQIEQEPKDCGLTFPTKWIWDKNASKFDFKATVNMGTPRNKTIVFVQGWQGFATNWGIVTSFSGADKLMRESGYHVFCPPLLTSVINTPRIAVNTEILSDYMRKISLWTGHSSDITLIAHSMGGIVARDYVERVMNKTNQLLVSRLFMFGSPHKGVINDLSFLDLDLSENPTGFQMILADTSLLQKVYIDFNPASMDDFNCNGNRARPSNVTYYYIGGSKSNFLLPNILESRLRGFILGKLSYSYGGSSIASRCANANINSGPDSTELLNQFDGVVGLRSSLRENQGEGYRLDYPSGIFVNHLNYFGNDMTQKSYADCLIPVLVKRNGDCGLKYSWQELGKYKTTDTTSYDNPPSSISLIQKNELIDTQTITQIIRIEGGNPTFAVKSPITPSIVMKLIDPTGKTIDFSTRSNVTEGNITYEKSTGLVAYKVQNALPGNWQISMRLANPVSTKLNAISFALLDTPAVLTVSLDRSVYPLNSKMVLSAKLANASFQSASVNAYINRGDGKVDVVPMTFDGKKFVAEYVIPPTIHYGFVEFEASGILQDGKAFERSSSIDFAAPGSSSYFPAVTNSLVNSETLSPCGSSDCYGLNSDYAHANAR